MKYVVIKRCLVYKNFDLGKGNFMILFLICFFFGYYKIIYVEYQIFYKISVNIDGDFYEFYCYIQVRNGKYVVW